MCNPATAPAPAKTCAHGECLGHSPEWIIASTTLVPNPGITGARTYWTMRHCGKGMTRYREEVIRACSHCNRKKVAETTKRLAVCDCCGFKLHEPNLSVNDPF